MEAKTNPDEFKLGIKSDSSSGDNIGKWDKPGIKSDRQKYQMIDENSFPGYKSDRSSDGNIGENSYPGLKSDSSVKGKEAMREEGREIFMNPRDSEILLSSEEKVSDFLSGNAFSKRAKINGAQLNSSEKEGLDGTEFRRGLCNDQENYRDE